MEEKVQEYEIEETRKQDKNTEQSMGDVYDVYSKAVGVHSRVSGMTEDYTLTRYDIDIYNQKIPKFIREQRKILRIIKSYLLIPVNKLREIYNTEEEVEKVAEEIQKEFNIIEELLIGELDECVLMGRTPKGEVIDAFLKHGLDPSNRENYDMETERPSVGNKLTERNRQ